MPRLITTPDREPRVATCLQLPQSTRERLEAAIDGKNIKSLTDAVVAASKLLPPGTPTKPFRSAKS